MEIDETKVLIEIGLTAKRMMAKYPYATVKEKKFYKDVAMIGKLAEAGVLHAEAERLIGEEEKTLLEHEIDEEVKAIRSSGEY